MDDCLECDALDRLNQLPSGRHYGGSDDSGCWVMVGRDLRDVVEWSIIPPAASLTLAWGAGGCTVEFAGGQLEVRTGDWMWIDAGLAHRGINQPGSNFATVFLPERYVRGAALDIAPIGAAAQRAQPAFATMLIQLAVLLLDRAATRNVELPFVDTILDCVGTSFAPLDVKRDVDEAVVRAALMLRDVPGSALRIADVAAAVGVSHPELSRRFKLHHHVTPELYRRHARLARATQTLAAGSTVMAAAHGAGFADTAHLSRTFRLQYGISPSRWVQLATSSASFAGRRG